MGVSNFASFHLARIDAAGVSIPLANEEITVREYGGSDLDTLESDDFGYVAGGEVAVDEGTVLEFYHATYPETFRQTAAGSPETAYSEYATFIVENLFGATPEGESEGAIYDYYLKDLTNDTATQYIGSHPSSVTDIKIPYESAFAKDVRLFVIARDGKNLQSTTDFEAAESIDVEIPSSAPGLSIGDDITDSTANRFLVIGALGVLAETPTIGALQSARRNAANSAWEAFTPMTQLSIGDTLGNSPITNAVLHIGAGVVAQSQKFKFDGSDLFLINPTAATVGAQTQNSPHIYFDGAKWRTDTSASEPMRVRASVKPNATDAASINSPTLVFSFWSPGQNSFQDSLTYGNNPNDYLSGRLKLANPAFSGWGGMLDVYYDGTFFFKKLNGDLAPIGANHVGANPSAFPTLNFLQDAPYGVSLNAYQGGRIRFAGGYPGTGVNALGSEWVQSDLPVSIGTGAAPSAKLHIIGTTEQQRVGYDTSNYFKTTVGSNGAVTFDGVGSAPKFIFADDVEISDGKDLIIGSTTGTKFGQSGSKWSFNGVTPSATQGGWEAINISVARTIDGDDTTAYLYDVVGTLINDLIAKGIFKA